METVIKAPVVANRQVRRDRSLWLMLGAIGALLVAGLVVAMIATRQPNSSYPANTPAGTVQRYLILLQNGRVDKAYGMTSRRTPRQAFHNRYDNWSQTSHKVTLVGSQVYGGHATVTVDISQFAAGPFGSSDSTDRMTFELARHGKGWRITSPDYLPY